VRKKSKNCQIYRLGFHCVDKNQKDDYIFLVYSQIWPNLARDDCYFGYE
jgi:hypothetical protein